MPKRTAIDGSDQSGRTRGPDRDAGGAVAAEVSRTEAAVEQLRSRIIDLTLEPGTRLDEALLLREYKLGRTPAREAINRLAAEKFVIIKPHRGGVFVRGLDLDEVGDIVMAHQVSENVLGQLCNVDDSALAGDLTAIQREYAAAVGRHDYLRVTGLNEQFHLRMYDSIGNSFIYDFAQSTHRHLRRLLMHLYTLEARQPQVHEEQFAANVAEHEQIIAAVRARERSLLPDLLHYHAAATQERLLQILRSMSVPVFPVRARRPSWNGEASTAADGAPHG